MSPTSADETIQARRKRLSMAPSACEGCKVRKIRCDRARPCSNCAAAAIACQRTTPSTRPADRRRYSKEAHLQEQIDRLEQLLCAAERQLRGRGVASGGPGTESVTEPVIPETGHTTNTLHSTEATTLYESDPAFTNHSIQASDIAQRTARDFRGLQPDLKASFSRLEALLQAPATDSSVGVFRFSGKTNGGQLLRPLPIDLVLVMIQEMKSKRPIFLCSYAVNDLSLVERLCQKIYFPTSPISSGDVAAMYGVLYLLLKEFMVLQSSLCHKYDIKHYVVQCGQSFNAAVESYDVLAVPSFENIFALLMGFSKAQDEAKPLLSYTLVSVAANQCQMLGYQKESTYRTTQAETNRENMRRLFWTTYVFEKHICLFFGRASSIQDVDIDAQYPALSTNPAIRPWDESFILAIKLANIQGQIYNKLYASAALKAGHSERTQCIDELSVAMQQWRVELEQINSCRVNNQKIFELSRHSWDIMYYSTFTSLLRAPATSQVEGGEIGSQCFHVARLSLESHLRCFGNYQTSGFLTEFDYANWVLLFSSFTPFIVTFLHAVFSLSASDVQLLEEVVESLQRLRRVSSSLERLYQICSLFVQIARGFLKTQTSCAGTYDERQDSLQFSNNGYASLFEPESLQNVLEADIHMANNEDSPLDPRDLSAILEFWATGSPSGIELFGSS